MRRKKQKEVLICIILFSLIAFVLALSYIMFIISPTEYNLVSRQDKMKEIEEKYGDKVLSWIRIQGTKIDMPVIYRDTDTDVQRQEYDFAWSYPETKTLTNRAIFTSHNVLNVSSTPLIENKNFRRFEQLPAFLYPSFAEENQFIQYSVGGKDYLYRIFSVSIVEEYKIDYDHDEYSQKKLEEYIRESENDSYYEYKTSVEKDDFILTLITCTRFFGPSKSYALKIDARKVRKNESVKPVALNVKSNYHIIEENMKVGERDEA